MMSVMTFRKLNCQCVYIHFTQETDVNTYHTTSHECVFRITPGMLRSAFLLLHIYIFPGLAATTASCETLLLSAAALANLTFMEPRTVWPLLEEGTAGKLLQAVKRRGPKVSVFLQEQAATVIANMAAVPESRPHLAEQRAVVALLCFLQIRHSPLQRAPEIAAAERVQQKSAIALSR